MRDVVIDTNVLVSSALIGRGHPFRIIELASAGALRLYYSDEILDEYIEVLSRQKFNFSPEKQATYIDRIKENGVCVKAPFSNIPFSDETDRVFYDVARACGALLITGNKRHYPDEDFILTPSEFIVMLEHNSDTND